jgi:hypothetical protein
LFSYFDNIVESDGDSVAASGAVLFFVFGSGGGHCIVRLPDTLPEYMPDHGKALKTLQHTVIGHKTATHGGKGTHFQRKGQARASPHHFLDALPPLRPIWRSAPRKGVLTE